MKVKYIKEGVFKTKEQVLKNRERENELSNQEKVAGVFNKVVVEKINYIIKTVIQESAIYPFTVGMFSERVDEYNNIRCEVKTSKKEVYCSLLENEKGEKEIHLTFDYGIFVHDTPKAKACEKLDITSWDMNDIERIDKEIFRRSVSNKIKNYINRDLVKPGMQDKEICDLILDSKIVVDNIYMYTNQNAVDKLTFCLSDNRYSMTVKNFVTKNKRDIGSMRQYFDNEEVIVESLLQVIDFGVPVEIELKVTCINPSSKLSLISDLFPDYDTLGDLEKGAGVDNTFMDCTEHFMDLHNYEMNNKCYKILKNQIENCSYIVFNYSDIFRGTFIPGKGFVYEQVGLPIVNDILIADSHDKFSSNIFIHLGYRIADPNLIVYIVSHDAVYMTKKGESRRDWYSRLDEVPISVGVYDENCCNKVKALTTHIAKLFGPVTK